MESKCLPTLSLLNAIHRQVVSVAAAQHLVLALVGILVVVQQQQEFDEILFHQSKVDIYMSLNSQLTPSPIPNTI
jgi:hypothetical protein